jgi:hypothetical protein
MQAPLHKPPFRVELFLTKSKELAEFLAFFAFEFALKQQLGNVIPAEAGESLLHEGVRIHVRSGRVAGFTK